MAKIKIELNSSGIREIMKSEAVQDLLSQEAKVIADRCGDGYEQDIHVGKTRANAMVWAETHKAKRDNLKNNTILKAVQTR